MNTTSSSMPRIKTSTNSDDEAATRTSPRELADARPASRHHFSDGQLEQASVGSRVAEQRATLGRSVSSRVCPMPESMSPRPIRPGFDGQRVYRDPAPGQAYRSTRRVGHPASKEDAMRRSLIVAAGLIAATASVLSALPSHALNSDTLITVGSPTGPFSANKQNEPAVAIDATSQRSCCGLERQHRHGGL